MAGYMTMAFDASKPDDAGPIGTFDMPTDGQVLSCPDGVNVRLNLIINHYYSLLKRYFEYTEHYISQR